MGIPFTKGVCIVNRKIYFPMKINFINNALSGLVRLFYPELCACCDTELKGTEKTLCLTCTLQLPRTAYHHIPENRSFQNFIGRVPITRATSFVYFSKQGMVQHLMHQFKYRGRKEIGHYLGQLFADELKKCNWLDTIDCIVPVPLHKTKKYQRGFNQACLFAEGIAAASGIPVMPGVIYRNKATESQTHKTRAARIENVREVFSLKQPEKIKGKHLLLVDDVLTTGATLESCALELLKAGQTRIAIATLALAID
jgi:ComF family protein